MYELGEPEHKRWYILIIFSLISCIQCNTWFTFSSVPDQIEGYYGLIDPGNNKVNGTIDLLLNWGPIIFIIITPLSVYLLAIPIKGLKYTVVLAATLVFFGNVIRTIPTFLNDYMNSYHVNSNLWNTTIFLHIGQILNAAAGPLVMGPPSKLSVIWFGKSQRNTATGIAAISNCFGVCVGFLIGPLIVQNKNKNVSILLYVDLLLAFIPFICTLIYFPKHPKKLPTYAAKNALLSVSMNDMKENESSNYSYIDNSIKKNLLEDISVNKVVTPEGFFIPDSNDNNSNTQKITLKDHFRLLYREGKEILYNYSAIMVITCGGIIVGAYNGWQGVYQDMISPIGLDSTSIGIIGTINTFGGLTGGILVGPIADKYFVKNLRKLMLIMLILLSILSIFVLFMLPSPFNDNPIIIINNNDTTTKKIVILSIFVFLMGCCEGSCYTLFYELSAEVSYPVSEGTSGMLLVFVVNIGCLIWVGIGNWISTKWETFLCLIVYIISILLLLTIKEVYKRK